SAGSSDPDPGVQPIDLRAERVQMFRNGLRGLAYVPTWSDDATSEPAAIAVQAVQVIRLDGDRTEDAWGNAQPNDPYGDGRYGFVHFDGTRVIRVFDADGRKLWEDRNPTGRIHRSPVHRDTLAVLDVNGDGRQDIVHCWAQPGNSLKMLVERDGATGA